jgi:uncharacterized membrane protein YczE
MQIKRKHLYRVLLYVAGLMVLALGVALSINSRLGISPVNSLPYVISQITGIEMGTCVIAVFSLFILVQILIKGKDFQWINLTQLIFSTLFGFFVDGAKALLGNFTLPTYVGQLVMLLISIGVIALGISLYLDARLVSMPSEGMTLALADKLKKPFNQVKTWTDSTLVTLAILLSLIFMGGLYGVREGTILSALLIGPTIKPIRKWTKPVVERVFFGD